MKKRELITNWNRKSFSGECEELNSTRETEMDVDEYVDLEATSGDDGNDDEPSVAASNAIALRANASPIEYSKQSRSKKLGFHPQKEIFCNKYLPYADQLDDESQQMLIDVKEMLCRAVALREMTPGVGVATGKLLW